MTYITNCNDSIFPCPFCGQKPVRWQYLEAASKWRISVMCDSDDCLVDVEVPELYRGSQSELEAEFTALEIIWNNRVISEK